MGVLEWDSVGCKYNNTKWNMNVMTIYLKIIGMETMLKKLKNGKFY